MLDRNMDNKILQQLNNMKTNITEIYNSYDKTDRDAIFGVVGTSIESCEAGIEDMKNKLSKLVTNDDIEVINSRLASLKEKQTERLERERERAALGLATEIRGLTNIKVDKEIENLEKMKEEFEPTRAVIEGWLHGGSSLSKKKKKRGGKCSKKKRLTTKRRRKSRRR